MTHIRKLFTTLFVLLAVCFVGIGVSTTAQASTAKGAQRSNSTMYVGETKNYKTSVYKKAKSDNTSVVSVTKKDNKYVVKAKKKGTATISLYRKKLPSGYREFRDEITITVKGDSAAASPLIVGQTLTYSARKVTSSKESVASVEKKNGEYVVTAKKTGTSTIKVDIGTKKTHNIKITVKNKATKSLSKNKTLSYRTSFYGKVTSSNSNVAKVTKKSTKYVVKGKKAGTSTLKLYDKKGKQVTKISLIVTDSKSFTGNTSDVFLYQGETSTLKAKVTKALKDKVSVTYSSDNKDVATVSKKGKITTKGVGTANITAKMTYKGKTIKKLTKRVDVCSPKSINMVTYSYASCDPTYIKENNIQRYAYIRFPEEYKITNVTSDEMAITTAWDDNEYQFVSEDLIGNRTSTTHLTVTLSNKKKYKFTVNTLPFVYKGEKEPATGLFYSGKRVNITSSSSADDVYFNDILYKGEAVADFHQAGKILADCIPVCGNFVKKYIKSGMSDKEKVQAIWDYIYKDLGYVYGTPNNSRYKYSWIGVLYCDHKAVCQGISEAAVMLALCAGLDEAYAVQSIQANHEWTAMKVDGKYYELDFLDPKEYMFTVISPVPITDARLRLSSGTAYCVTSSIRKALKNSSNWGAWNGVNPLPTF